MVVPARDEEITIGSALGALRRAAVEVHDSAHVEIVVVANACVDRTADIVRAEGARLLVGGVANVGAARAQGAAWALRREAGRLDRLWLATTDADSQVPTRWLSAQLRAADAGADGFVGTIALERKDAMRHPDWVARYADDGARWPRHGHIHGANMGVRARRYLAVGGFRAMVAHEDADLVGRLERSGAHLAWVADVPVLTSARHQSRVGAGVATDLAVSLEPRSA